MRRYTFIALGGIAGAMARYFIKNINIYSYNGPIPLNTLTINIVGSFLLALLLTTALQIKSFDEDIRIGIGTGFLGAFTTFSTMCKEIAALINSGHYYVALSYTSFSILLGLAAAYFGAAASKAVVKRYAKHKTFESSNNKEILEDKEDVS